MGAVTVLDREILASLDPGILRLILMPTEACNFRCVYCYEEFKHKRMEPTVVEGVKNLLARRIPELRKLTLSWFGGEPLLARDIVEEILDHARSLLGSRPRVRFESDITTNGYLLSPEVLEGLLSRGVTEYQISLDGPRRWHDRKRVRADGKPTFERIWNNLRAMRRVEGEFVVVVRIHADRENFRDLPDLIDQCDATFGEDPRFLIFVRPLSRLGGPNDARLPVLDEREDRTILADLERRARGARVRHVSALETSGMCYAAQAHSFLVRADGRLNKCTVALEHPANQVGRLRTDGRIDASARLVKPWMRGLWSRHRAELDCPMIGLADPVTVETVPGLAQGERPAQRGVS